MVRDGRDYGDCSRGAGLRFVLGTSALVLLAAACCFLVVLSAMAFFLVSAPDEGDFLSGDEVSFIDEVDVGSSDVLNLADYPQD